jgi:hypothetical protein
MCWLQNYGTFQYALAFISFLSPILLITMTYFYDLLKLLVGSICRSEYYVTFKLKVKMTW